MIEYDEKGSPLEVDELSSAGSYMRDKSQTN